MSESSSARAPMARMKRLGFNSTNVLFGTQTGRAFLQLLSNQALSRLLYPEAFAIIMLVGGVQFAFALATDLGVIDYAVRSDKTNEPKVLDAIWTFEVIRGALLAIMVFVLAGPIAALCQEPMLENPLRFLSLIIFVKSLRSMGHIESMRERQDWRNNIIAFGAFILQILITIGLAVLLRSHWALVFGLAAATLIEVIFSYIFYKNPWRRFRYDPEVLKNMWGFSKFIFASSLLTIVIAQADKFFMVRELPIALAGCYAIATRFTGIGNGMVHTYFGRIYYAEISERLRNNADLTEAYYEPLKRMRPFLAFFCAGGLFFAQPALEILLDDRYLPAGVFAGILVLAPLVGTGAFPAERFLVASNRAKVKFYGDILRGAWILGAMPLAYIHYGMMGLVWAVGLFQVPPLLLYYVYLYRMGIVRWQREVTWGLAILGGLATGGLAAYGYSFIRHIFVGAV